MALLSWDEPLRHRISGSRVYVIKASSSKHMVALGYAEHGPAEEIVMRNGMRSPHSQFLDLENCSEWDFKKQKSGGSKSKTNERIKAKREQSQIEREKRAKQREIDALSMANHPLWGSF